MLGKRRGLPFGAPARGVALQIQLNRSRILGYLLSASILLVAGSSALQVSGGLPLAPSAGLLACVAGAAYGLRRLGRDAAAATVFIVGSYVILAWYCSGRAGSPNGLANGAAYSLLLYPFLVWATSPVRWQRLATIGVVCATLLGLYLLGQPADQGFSVPDEVFALSLLRCYFTVAMILVVLHSFETAIDASIQRAGEAAGSPQSLDETLRHRTVELERAVAAQAETEKELRSSQSHYRHLFTNAFDGIVVFDWEQQQPIDINETLSRRLGYTPARMLTAHPVELSPEFQADGRPSAEVGREISSLLQTVDSARYPWRHVTSTGELVDFDVHTFCIDGSRRTRVSMLRDVTEQKRAERGLVQANKELRDFGHAASHDLKEPLRTMSNFAQLLERRYGASLDDRGRQYVRFITDAGRRGTQLVDDLLKYAETGTNEVDLVPVDLAEVGIQVKATVDARLREEGAVLTIGPLPTVTLTPTWGQQLLQNLISNALKFKRPGVTPRVTVSARETTCHHEVAVRDNGIGISEENLDRVFGIFTRLVLRDEYEGSGIGLALCRRIMQRAGGDIRVSSVLGEGTTFTLVFPKVAGVGVRPASGSGVTEHEQVLAKA